ncbi:MAG TPA: GH25 family lysozyme [Ferruginibacter sp.]|nr:GH25 family lysozyme [Ferruginibacter sp.]
MAKIKRRFAGRIVFLLILLSIISAGAFYLWSDFYKPSFIHYPAFGIDIPAGYTIHGIDVSRHQDIISWPAVKKMKIENIKIDFAFIKATEGIGKVDIHFKRNWRNAQKEGIRKGAYHFFIASKSGKAQAENFIETVRLQKGDLPPVLDVENTYGASKEDLQQRVADWLLMTEKKFRVRPVIYTNVDFYNLYLAGRFDDYPLWVAHYLVQDKPRIERSWIFWQHNESGHVDGIGARVDFNVFNGDSTAFQQLLVK